MRGLGSPIPPRSVGTLYIATQLNASAIRIIRESAPSESWRLLGGGLALQISAELEITPSSKLVRFELEDQRPIITAFWLMAAQLVSTTRESREWSPQETIVLSILKELDGDEAVIPLLLERSELGRLELEKAIDELKEAGMVKRHPATYEALPAITLTPAGRDYVLKKDLKQ
jgi:hypothetical protein